MKTFVMFAVWVVLVSVLSLAGAEGERVTAEELVIADVEKIARNHCANCFDRSFAEVVGIYQEGKRAEVYYRYRIDERTRKVGTINLVKLNSGAWFNPHSGELVLK